MFNSTQRIVFGLTLCGLLLAGCTAPSEKLDAMAKSAVPTGIEINVPPKELVEVVKQVVSQPPLSMSIQEQRDGLLITGWKQYQGEFHIARHWQERTRYLIQIIPDWDQPTQKSTIQVTAQSEQRAASQQPWQPAPEIQRPERAEEVLKQIQQAIANRS